MSGLVLLSALLIQSSVGQSSNNDVTAVTTSRGEGGGRGAGGDKGHYRTLIIISVVIVVVNLVAATAGVFVCWCQQRYCCRDRKAAIQLKPRGSRETRNLLTANNSSSGTGTKHLTQTIPPESRGRAYSTYPKAHIESEPDPLIDIADGLIDADELIQQRRGSRRQSEWCTFQDQLIRNEITAEAVLNEKQKTLDTDKQHDVLDTVPDLGAANEGEGLYYHYITPTNQSVTASGEKKAPQTLKGNSGVAKGGRGDGADGSRTTNSRVLPPLPASEGGSILYDVYYETSNKIETGKTQNRLQSQSKNLQQSREKSSVKSIVRAKVSAGREEKSSDYGGDQSKIKSGVTNSSDVKESMIAHIASIKTNDNNLVSESSLYEDIQVMSDIVDTSRKTISDSNHYEEVVDDGFTELTRGKQTRLYSQNLALTAERPTADCEEEYEYCVPYENLDFKLMSGKTTPKVPSEANPICRSRTPPHRDTQLTTPPRVISRATKSRESYKQSSLILKSGASTVISSTASGGRTYRHSPHCVKHKSCKHPHHEE